MAIFSNFITTRAGFPNNEISTGNLLISASSITSSATTGRDELVSNTIGGSFNLAGGYRLSAFTTIDTRAPIVSPYPARPLALTSTDQFRYPVILWNALSASLNPYYGPGYFPTLLHVRGNQDSSQVYPPDPQFVNQPTPFQPLGLATFASNVALLVSGGLHVANDKNGFNTIQGITHIPANNALVFGGKLLTRIVSESNNRYILNHPDKSTRLQNNITIFGGGMGIAGSSTGENLEYRNSVTEVEAGSGLNIWGWDNYRNKLYGTRFEMANFVGDTDGSRFGRSFGIRMANPYVGSSNGQFTNKLSIVQYSFFRNELILGTVELGTGAYQGKTRLISGHQIEITSKLQVGDYAEEPILQRGTILYAGLKHRFAGSTRSTDPESLVFFDNVKLYATASVLPNFGTDYQYALTVRSSSGIYARDPTGPTTWQIGLGIVSGSGGGGASLLPGGDNYDIQYNVTRGGNPPRFGGAAEISQTFEYVYDATPDPLFRFNGRMQGGNPGNRANGIGSMAFGLANTATADYSIALGANTTTTGLYALAVGIQSTAAGTSSFAQGSYTTAAGDYSHAEGYQTTASGHYSHAEGYRTIASGLYSHAEGLQNRAIGTASHAEGYLTTASNSYSHAEGVGTVTLADYQHAEGSYNIPSSTALWVLGDGTSAAARHNLIEGHTGQVRFSGSLFIQPGQGYLPSAVQSTVLTYNPSTGQIQLMNTSSFTSGGGGVSGPQYWIQDGTRLYTSGGFQNVQVTGSLYAVGDTHTFVGTTTVLGGLFIQPKFVPTTVVTSGGTNPMILAYNTTTGQVQKTTLTAVGAAAAPPTWSIQFNRGGNFGGTQFFIYSESVNTVFAATQLNIGLRNRVNRNTYGVVMGSQSFAEGIGSFAQGLFVTASGIYSHAQGTGSRATGDFSHAEGQGTRASGRYSHAEGWLTRAAQDYTHAEGYLTLAEGTAAHAEGREVTASGGYSHAEGYQTKALFEYAHAEGKSTIASGSGAHAEGKGTQALGDASHAEGWDTKATGDSSHAEGRLNLASGLASTVRGRQSTASGDYSQASGFRVEALAPYQQVFGQYNVPSTDTGSLFIIGAGFNGQDKNALVITTASMIFSSSLYFADGVDYTSRQPFLPRASQSLMFVYDQATGQVELMHTSSLLKDGYWIQNGSTLFTSGGFSTVSITGSLHIISGSSYKGMRTDIATKTSVSTYQLATGSDNLTHAAPGVGNDSTIYFPTTPRYGTTFTLVVDSPGTTYIQTGSRQGADPIYRIQSPSSTGFIGAVYGNSFTAQPGVYNYTYLNISSGSIGNAWVLTFKM